MIRRLHWSFGRRGATANPALAGFRTTWNPSPVGQVHAVEVSGGSPRSNLAALDASTGVASSWAPVVSGPGKALAVTGSSGYVGGAFAAVGGLARSHIAAVDVATGDPTSWNPGTDSTVNTLAATADAATVYAGGIQHCRGTVTTAGSRFHRGG